MAVITITVVATEKEYVAGIPASVSITTNIPSTIFYTLDGTTPTTSSSIYYQAIELPTENPSVTLNIFATNGVDVDARMNLFYSPDWTNARLPHAKVIILNPATTGWCGTRGEPQKVLYTQPASYTVHQAGVADKSYDGYGYEPSIFPMRGSNESIPIFDLRYSDSNSKGEMGRDIGTLPKVSIIYTPQAPEETDANKATFNARAMVMFQDGTKPDENDYIINKQFFSSANYEKSTFGTVYGRSNLRDGNNGIPGTLLRYIYNEKEGTVTFYYRDRDTNQWIISKEAVDRAFMGKNLFTSLDTSKVYRWVLFRRSALI